MVQTFLRTVLTCGVLALISQPARAQTQPPACTRPEKYFSLRQVASLAGCPFSAVMEFESNQTLADGTHIQRKSKALIYRDSSGRIRYESYPPTYPEDASQSPRWVQIYDPVAGFMYSLTPQEAVAARSSINDLPGSPKANAQAQRMPAQDSVSKQREELRPKRVAEKLGTQLMQGLLATGRRDTLTYPTGAQGNDRPFTTVSEIWESSGMGIRLLMKNSDPRIGETEERITSLDRSEPDPSLFQIPADYTIKGN